MSILHVAHEPPKNVLIAELYSREQWESSFAFYEGFTEVGWLIGLLLGLLVSIYGFSPITTLLLCSGLNLIALTASALLVTDPLLVFERGLVSIERTVDFTHRGVFLVSKMLDGLSTNEKLKRENINAFCAGLVLFSLATSILFTPMPIFISEITRAADLPTSIVFAIFVLSSSGGIAGYVLAGKRSGQLSAKANLGKLVVFRGFLAFLLIAVIQVFAYRVALTTLILMLMGFAYAMFMVFTLSLSMELIPAGRAGLFNVLVGIGGACGSFVGPFIAETFSFGDVFLVSGIIFFMAYVAFRIFR
jgi:hypothetical protein